MRGHFPKMPFVIGLRLICDLSIMSRRARLGRLRGNSGIKGQWRSCGICGIFGKMRRFPLITMARFVPVLGKWPMLPSLMIVVVGAFAAARPAASGQRPAASGQRPAASGQRPAASGQRPAASGQRPAASDCGNPQNFPPLDSRRLRPMLDCWRKQTTETKGADYDDCTEHSRSSGFAG